MERKIKYPVGIQTFSKIIEDNYLYVDKTELIFKLVHDNQFVFLSRPRRFGKSLLVSTIEAYFQGREELFKGLAIESLETQWQQYPVLRFDLSGESYEHADKLFRKLNMLLAEYEAIYGSNDNETDIGGRFRGIIRRASENAGAKVVILIDEYDKPILETLHDEQLQHNVLTQLRGFYSVLKESDAFIRFAMLTGVTKFAHVSIFSGLNNLNDISLLNQYNALCGISDSEFREYFRKSVAQFAELKGMPEGAVWEIFKINYDGYRFSQSGEGIYNPFSVLTAFNNEKLSRYWFASGSPNYLIEIFRRNSYNLSQLEGSRCTEEHLTDLSNPEADIIPLLYQSGYLTIKGYDEEYEEYTLGFPNDEVYSGFWSSLYKNYMMEGRSVSEFDVREFVNDVRDGHPDDFMNRLSSLIATLSPGTLKDKEIYFHNILQIIFSMTGFYVDSEIHISSGRIDMALTTDRYVYIFEFKINQSAQTALNQIYEKAYAKPYMASEKEIFLIGANFSTASNNLDSYLIATL